MKRTKKERGPRQKVRKIRPRWIGIWLMIIGVAFQFLNMITYGLWGIDIDIFGVLIFIVGLVITIVKWRTK